MCSASLCLCQASGCLVSLATTLASPCKSMHFLTAFRMSCNRRSKARRWGSVRTGARGSCSRDSLITALSWYSGSASSCRRSSVVRFILEEKEIRRPSAKLHSTPARDSCLSPLLREGRGREDTVPGNNIWNKKLLLK